MSKYFKKFEGKNLFLSPVNTEDYITYTSWMNDLKVTVGLGNTTMNVSTLSEKEFIEKLAKDGHNFAIVHKQPENLIGNCSIFNINNMHGTAEVGLFIGDEQYRSKGYGQEALELLLCYGFKILNLNNIMLRVFSFNEMAIKSYKNAGFKEFGRRTHAFKINGKRFDEVYMEIMAQSFNSECLSDRLPS